MATIILKAKIRSSTMRLFSAALAIATALLPLGGVEEQSGTVATEEGHRNEQLLKLTEDTQVVSKGKEIYAAFCLACHGPEGTEIDSPSNLFDEKWYHFSAPTGIERSIREGVIEKGMPAWGQMVPDPEIESVVVYLLSFQPHKLPNSE